MLQSINVLKNMKVGLKLGLVIFFMVIPIISLMALLFSKEQKLIQAARSELNGIEYLGYLKDISLHIPQHSDLNKLYLSGDSSQEERMTALQLRIDQALQTLAAAETEHGQTLETAAIFQELRQSWERFRQDWKELGPIANAEHHCRHFLAGRIHRCIFQRDCPFRKIDATEQQSDGRHDDLVDE